MDQASPAQAARLIQFALLSGVVAVAVVIAIVIEQVGPFEEPEFPAAITWIGGLTSVAFTAIAFWLRSAAPAQVAKMTNLTPRERAIRAALLPAATLEGAMLFNLLGWLLRQDPWPHVAFAMLPFCVAVAFLIQPIELEGSES